MKLSLKNWEQPSNKKLKKIADVILYAFPLVDVLIVTKSPFHIEANLWIGFILGLIVIGFKAFTKFTAEETGNEQNS